MADAGGGSSSPTLEEYDVFLSFRGEDTRNNFTSHLHAALKRQNIKTYFDEESLERGKEISPDLLEAIQKSKISVIVFSKNYASSSWCLRELAHIVQCHQEKGQIVFPIFHEVDPSHVRKQDGSYGDAFVKHEKDFKDNGDMVEQWRDALRTSANLAGFDSKATRPEAKLIEDIVKAIWGKLCSSIVSSGFESKGLFGFENQFKDIESLLRIDSPDVRVVGIWGMGGIGKTTLADRIFSRFSSHFEGRCHFIRNLREKSEKCELEKSRDELFAKLLKVETANLGTLSIPDYMKERVSRTKVLIILDDLSDSKQLESLNIGDDVCDIGKQFGDGSRIVITTRDAGVLRDIGVNDYKYKVKNLKDDEGLQLFNLIAFRGKAPQSDYIELSYQVVKKVGGNPLAIKVLGSHLRSLRSPSKENWKMELDKLKEVPLYDIHKVLRISYHGLDDKEKNIFLDIACFFKGMSRDFIENILNCCGFFASTGIDKLIDKSLISYNNNVLDMHDLVQEMGWKIVREESEEPGERSRVWTTKEACHALMNDDNGSKTIKGVFLDFYGKKDVHLRSTVFQEMRNLRFLSFYDSHLLGEGSRVIYSPYYRRFKVSLEALEFLPHSLRYLEWHDYPLNSLPSNFKAQNLVVLNMPGSQLEQLWNGVQELNNLKIMDLRHSYHLTQIPDLSRAPNLESISLQNCESLIQFPWHSLQYLEKLAHLNLNACEKLTNVSGRIDGRIVIGECPNINISTDLVTLWLFSAPIQPSSIAVLNNLSELRIYNCQCLTNIPSSMRELDSLKVLELHNCLSLEMFPELPRNIKEIIFSQTAIKEVPSASIKDCSSLSSIKMTLCSMLESLPTSIFELRSLAFLDLSESPNLKRLPEIAEPVQSLCELNLVGTGIEQLPESIGNLVGIKNLNLRGCGNLRYLPPSIGNLLCLCELNLDKTGIEQLPESIGNLAGIRKLNLRGCANLRYLPPSIGNLLSFCALKLEETGLELLLESIGNLAGIKKLNLRGCANLRYLPPSIGNLLSLCELNLEETGIEQLPEWIGNLVGIKNLNMRGCRNLMDVPPSIGNLLCLCELNLEETEIEQLPEWIGNLVGIKNLNLRGCANLRYLPPSIGNLLCLCELNLGETGIEQLPESIGNLVNIEELNLRGCANLRYLPLSIGNLLCLREFDLEETGIEQLPESIANLLCLERLKLACSHISEIPASIKRLPKLKILSIQFSYNLVSLPVLPVSLQYLYATSCKSLKFVSPPNRVLIQGLQDNDKIAEDSCECLCFTDCFELDKNAKLNIISCFQLSVLRKATRFVRTEDEHEIPYSASVTTLFPGSEIPIWFNHQSEGASIHIKLPQNWHNSSFLGFAVCAVIGEFEGDVFPLKCTIDLINAKEHRDFGRRFDSGCFENNYGFDLNHVCMWYKYDSYRDYADALEAEINFYLPDQEISGKIERCGMQMLYREDVEKFTAQYLLLDQSANVTDQLEPSTRGTSVSVSEEPPSKRTKHTN